MAGPPLRAAFLLALLAPAACGFTLRGDVSYGDGSEPARRLDVYAPDQPASTRLPVVIYVHGGGWFKGDKAKVGSKPEWLTRLGFVFVSVNYRLLPAGRHPANAEDIAAAVAWVRRRIAEYGGDPEAMVLLGHSTGAHLVSLVATDERFLGAHGLGLDDVAGVIAVDTNCYDLEARIRDLHPEDRGLYLAAFGGHAARWRDASPLTHVTAGKALPPFLLLTAGESSTHLQTEAFARALARVGATARTATFPRETHGSLNHRLGKPGHRPTTTIETFFDGLLPRRSAGGEE